MFHLIAHARKVSGMFALFAITSSLVACGSPELADSAEEPEAQSEAATANLSQPSFPGLPDFHKPPHERAAAANGSAERLSSGYHYAQGQFDANTWYGVYSYMDPSWTYMSTSIWGSDNSSLSSGMDISASGDTWLQSGSYYLDENGVARGDYSTSYVSAAGVSTLYLTDFSSSSAESEYKSIIDYSNTAASPDCTYDSRWANNASSAHQLCFRPNSSFWSCDYEYSYEPQTDVDGEVVGVKYISSQSCNDSITPDRNPDYSYTDIMVWDYLSGTYSDQAEMVCYEKDSGSKKTFVYAYADGVSSWTDKDSGEAVSGPTCGWELAGN